MGEPGGLIRGMEGWAESLDSIQGGGLGEKGLEYRFGSRVVMRLLTIPGSLAGTLVLEELKPFCMAWSMLAVYHESIYKRYNEGI